MTYNIGDLIQMKAYPDIGVVVDIKWNGAAIHIHWLNNANLLQSYPISYIDKWANKISNCGPIQNP
jgi:hypothetical protein